MFFRNGERLIIQGQNLHKDYQRYNEITRNIYTSKVGEFAIENVFRKSEGITTSYPKNIELSLWRVTDRNVSAWERGIDRSEFVLEKPDKERISYVIVPRMNTDTTDLYPCEYTEQKDSTFEDINDPRVIVMARSYKGIIGELAKDFTLKNEEAIRSGYKFLTDDRSELYSEFSSPAFLKAVTSQAVRMFEPNVYATFHPEEQSFAGSTFSYEDPIAQIVRQDISIADFSGSVKEEGVSDSGDNLTTYTNQTPDYNRLSSVDEYKHAGAVIENSQTSMQNVTLNEVDDLVQ